MLWYFLMFVAVGLMCDHVYSKKAAIYSFIINCISTFLPYCIWCCYDQITLTEQGAVFTRVCGRGTHSCKVIKYACIKMSCVYCMNLGSLLKALLFNQC